MDLNLWDCFGREKTHITKEIRYIYSIPYVVPICFVIIDHDFKENVKSFKDTLRLSYGAGVVLRLGRIARLELNYVWPLWLLPGDK